MQATEWTNPDDLCNGIIRAFTTSQSKKFLKDRFRNNSAPWFNVEIYELLRERNFHYLREAYRDAQLALKKAIFERKKQYFHDKIRRAADDSKKLWKSLNELVSGSSKKESKQIKSLTKDNVEISDAKQIAQELNHFFTSIGHQVDHSPPPWGYAPPRPHSERDMFCWRPTTPNEIREIIRAMKPGKTIGQYHFVSHLEGTRNMYQ
ncbi:hypothetical protein HHI36_000475 [Cryptolaemus montrouzieri]|uniref:Uncharacterized protein n=1 Tax=Cryptolaemus montrouzieri TaxID=559131 RepID=A0ABD2P553_9CUCU